MIELRWVVPPNTNTEPARLQYRVGFTGITIVGERPPEWSDWRDVPTVVEPAPKRAEGES